MELFKEILEELDGFITTFNDERVKEGGFMLPKTKITLLGQFSLLANPTVSSVFQIPATMDVDAKLEADYLVKKSFKEILKKHGLEYDEQSELIWIPKESTFDPIFKSPRIECVGISPIYGILSKAIKAKEKNKFLVQQAIAHFGEDLIRLIEKYKGDPEYFLKD